MSINHSWSRSIYQWVIIIIITDLVFYDTKAYQYSDWDPGLTPALSGRGDSLRMSVFVSSNVQSSRPAYRNKQINIWNIYMKYIYGVWYIYIYTNILYTYIYTYTYVLACVIHMQTTSDNRRLTVGVTVCWVRNKPRPSIWAVITCSSRHRTTGHIDMT